MNLLTRQLTKEEILIMRWSGQTLDRILRGDVRTYGTSKWDNILKWKIVRRIKRIFRSNQRLRR